MVIKLIKQIPPVDGYYLMKFGEISGLHLVLIQTELDGSRIMIPDDPKHYISFKLDAAHSPVLEHALFSKDPIIIEKSV